MSAGIRILIAIGALLLFLALRLMALFRVDQALLGWLAGGSHGEPELVPVKVRTPR